VYALRRSLRNVPEWQWLHLQGLADTLRNEFVLYDIDVHIFFPPTMYTPGYEEENKTKPKITLKIEEDDKGLTADQAADALLKGAHTLELRPRSEEASFLPGVTAGHAHITGDILTEIFRASTRGSAKGHNWIWDSILDSIGHVSPFSHHQFSCPSGSPTILNERSSLTYVYV
jgi:3-dehydrosphinganine reductase